MADDSAAPVVVLGGSGHYGRHIVHSLVALGAPVRVLSRNPEAARQLLPAAVEVVPGDIEDETSLRACLSGARSTVIAVSAFSRRLVHRMRAIEHDAVVRAFALAQEVGVPRLVLISTYGVDRAFAKRFGMLAGEIKADVEEALARTELNWTVLGAPPATDIFFSFIRGSTMTVPGGGPPALPSVSVHDLGRIAAEAALRDDLAGQRFRITGPEALSFAQAAARISQVWGREIRFQAVPLALPIAFSAVAGLFVPYVRHVVAALRMMNQFPADLAAQVPQEHARLRQAFDYTPRTIEDDAAERRPAE